MNQCPFCGHANEDGTLYCDLCKTDLSIPTPAMPSVLPESAPLDFTLEKIDPSSSSDELVATKKLDQIPMVETLTPEPETSVPTVEPNLLGVLSPASVSQGVVERVGEDVIAAPTVEAPKLQVVPPTVKPKLVVIRGEKIDMDYPIYPGKNYIGRTDDKPVDIDLENQEPKDRIWSSRQHAIITFENGVLTIEDLNSLNGTFVNRTRVHPGQDRTLQSGDIIQIGTVQMKVVLGSQG